METVEQFELNIQQENGAFEKITVSRDFMELCFTNAKNIVEKVPNEIKDGAGVGKAIEEITSDHNQRNIIGKMVSDLLELRSIELVTKHAFREMLKDTLQELLGG